MCHDISAATSGGLLCQTYQARGASRQRRDGRRFPLRQLRHGADRGTEEGPHNSNTACTSVTVRGEVGLLEDASRLRGRTDLQLDDVMKGPNAAAGAQRLELFQAMVRRASFDAVMARSRDAGPASCMEVELRKVGRHFL